MQCTPTVLLTNLIVQSAMALLPLCLPYLHDSEGRIRHEDPTVSPPHCLSHLLTPKTAV